MSWVWRASRRSITDHQVIYSHYDMISIIKVTLYNLIESNIHLHLHLPGPKLTESFFAPSSQTLIFAVTCTHTIKYFDIFCNKISTRETNQTRSTSGEIPDVKTIQVNIHQFNSIQFNVVLFQKFLSHDKLW